MGPSSFVMQRLSSSTVQEIGMEVVAEQRKGKSVQRIPVGSSMFCRSKVRWLLRAPGNESAVSIYL